MSYRKFWVWPKRKGEIFGSILSNEDFEVAINEHCLENSFQVIELAALEACQKRLGEALVYLQRARNTMSCYDDCDSLFSEEERCNCGTENDMHEIDTFLSQIKDEGE